MSDLPGNPVHEGFIPTPTLGSELNRPMSLPSSEGRSDSIYMRSPVLTRRHAGWVLGLPAYLDPGERRPPVIVAVGGGKGGVGKSLVSANLAVRLAATGKKVLAIDAPV